VSASQELAEALLVRDGIIVAIGTDTEVEKEADFIVFSQNLFENQPNDSLETYLKGELIYEQ
jgi:predicted amidohydrolase YtcJ